MLFSYFTLQSLRQARDNDTGNVSLYMYVILERFRVNLAAQNPRCCTVLSVVNKRIHELEPSLNKVIS